MANESEVIRHQMEDTRTDLSDKLEILEGEFADTVHNVTDSVSDTVQNVKDTVQDTVSSVKDTIHETLDCVKSTFDISHQVDRHPWLMLGGAVAVGYVGCCVLHRLEGAGEEASSSSFGDSYGYAADGREKSSRTQWLGEVAEKFQPEIAQLKSLAIGAALSIVRDLLSRSLPEQARQQVAETVDGFTTKLGGKPMQGLLPERQHDPEPAMK